MAPRVAAAAVGDLRRSLTGENLRFLILLIERRSSQSSSSSGVSARPSFKIVYFYSSYVTVLHAAGVTQHSSIFYLMASRVMILGISI